MGAKVPEQEMKDLLEEFIGERDRGKECYKHAEEIVGKLLVFMPTDTVYVLSDGRQIKLVDNFEKTNVIFRPAAARRFDIVELKDKDKLPEDNDVF